MNFEHLIKVDNEWLNSTIKKMGFKEFQEYSDRVYRRLLQMDIGEYLNLLDPHTVRVENRELFIKTISCFLSEGNDLLNGYWFNKDATKLTRHKVLVQKKKPKENTNDKS
jgi:Arc/MetJ family transcription regulator